jgi:hypothetical protein
MIGFDDVVQVFADPVRHVDRQLALSLQSADSLRVGAELVRGNRRRRQVAHRSQRFSQETIGCPGIAAICQHEVDQAAVLVNGPKNTSLDSLDTSAPAFPAQAQTDVPSA